MSEFLADWFRRDGLPESRFAELTEVELAELLARDESLPLWCGHADIAFAFGRLYYEEEITAAERDIALRAIERQSWNSVLRWQG